MNILITLLALSLSVFAQDKAHYKVLKGTFHKGGTVLVTVLPNEKKYDVQLEYEVKKKDLVPVPSKLLKGSKIYEFPVEFRTEAGYQNLEKVKQIEIPKAILQFVKKEDIGELKGAYVINVLPTNKKTKIEIIYHPSLPSVGWSKVKITFISNIPFLDGYELLAELVK